MVDFITNPTGLRDTLFRITKDLRQVLGDAATLSTGVNTINSDIQTLQNFGVRFGQVVDDITAADDLENLGSGTFQLVDRLNPTVLESGVQPIHNYYLKGFAAGTAIAVARINGNFYAIAGENSSVTIVTATGTTTMDRPVGAKSLSFILQAAGGGGGAGEKDATGNTGSGGGGGGGGGLTVTRIPIDISYFETTYKLVVGVGGPGAAAQSTNGTSGGNGTAGGDTQLTKTDNTVILTAVGGGLGVGGPTGTAGAAGTGNFNGGAGGAGTVAAGNGGAAPNLTLTTGTHSGATGGGGGAARAGGTTQFVGGVGGSVVLDGGMVYVAGGAGGIYASHPAGSVGTDSLYNEIGGAGGGGGSAEGSGTPTNATTTGGNGGLYGGGGGGGGGGINSVRNGGGGGDGGQGLAIQIANY